MTPKAGRYAAAATAGLAIAASLTACKSGADQASGGKPAGGVHLTSAQDALVQVSNQTAGLTSFKGTMSLSTLVSGQKSAMSGTMVYRLKPTPAMKFDVPTMNVNGKNVNGFTEILAGKKLYMKMPALTARTGKPWIGIPLDALSKSTGVDLGSAGSQGNQGDPSMNAKMLTASKDVHEVGKETIGGVATTHYRGTFNLQEALAKLSSQQRQAEKTLTAAGVDGMNFDIWVDGRQLPRRMTLATQSGAKLDMKMAMTFRDFNAPVKITAPPKSQVSDSPGLPGGGTPNMPT
jgi:hypothetical protein